MGLVHSCWREEDRESFPAVLMDGPLKEQQLRDELVVLVVEEEPPTAASEEWTPDDRLLLEAPFELLEVPLDDEGDTPEDSECSLLSDPRFSAFLVQSPSIRRQSDLIALYGPGSPQVQHHEAQLEELYDIIKRGDIESFMLMPHESLGTLRFEVIATL